MLTSPRAALATVALTLLTVVGSTSIVMSPAEGAAGVQARRDVASTTAGQSVTVAVLANDTISTRGAKVWLPRGTYAWGTARIVKQKVRITTTEDALPSDYRIRYRVKDRHGRADTAKILLTVAPAGNPATTTPIPDLTPSPILTQTPVPDPSPTPVLDPAPDPVPDPDPQPDPDPEPETNTLRALIAALPVAPEVRTGYDRATWKHWNSGSAGIPYCDTRDEVLISESVVTATWSGTNCRITGQWYSYYDGVSTTDSSTFDIDHMVALAEAHDSGGYAWSAATKEAFANDQGDPRSLVAVTASSNRGKGDKDPGEWLPLLERCRYIGEWVAVKHRWDLTADQAEKDALTLQASNCENVTITVIER